MRRALRTGFLAALAVTGLAHAGVVKDHGALKVVGKKVTNAAGTSIQLAGMSLNWGQWQGSFFNATSVTETVKWGASIIRVPMDVSNETKTASFSAGRITNVKAVVDAAIAADIYVIVDWHVEGGEVRKSDAITFFKEMVNTYKGKPNLIWEIWNEPTKSSWGNEIKPYAQEMIKVIRDAGSTNLVIVGTPEFSHLVDSAARNPLSTTQYPNVAYTLHFYTAGQGPDHVDSDNDYTRSGADFAVARIPLFMTEWGVSENSGAGSINLAWADTWLAFAKTRGISWCNWSISSDGKSSSALSGSSFSSLTASGNYIKGKIKEVRDALPGPTISTLPTAPSTSFAARATSQGLALSLPVGATEVKITDLQGRTWFQKALSGQQELLVPTQAKSVAIVQVTLPQGTRSATVMPSR